MYPTLWNEKKTHNIYLVNFATDLCINNRPLWLLKNMPVPSGFWQGAVRMKKTNPRAIDDIWYLQCLFSSWNLSPACYEWDPCIRLKSLASASGSLRLVLSAPVTPSCHCHQMASGPSPWCKGLRPYSTRLLFRHRTVYLLKTWIKKLTRGIYKDGKKVLENRNPAIYLYDVFFSRW